MDPWYDKYKDPMSRNGNYDPLPPTTQMREPNYYNKVDNYKEPMFLTCMFCNRQFPVNERDEYDKHVENCKMLKKYLGK